MKALKTHCAYGHPYSGDNLQIRQGKRFCRECGKRYKREYFNRTRDRLNEIWKHMKQRCYNPNDKDYAGYGGRGILICTEWHDYATFRDWALANGYRDTLTIDRVDNDVGYRPDNCRWATVAEQNRNKRNTKLTEKQVAEIRADKRSLRELSEKYGITPENIKKVQQGILWAPLPSGEQP